MASGDVVLVGGVSVSQAALLVVGSILAVMGSLALDSARSRRELVSAMQVVIFELDEDRSRLGTPHSLTLGDWEQNKGALSQLALKRPLLWYELARTYGQIYEFRRWSELEGPVEPLDNPPTEDGVTTLMKKLTNYSEESLPKRIRYFLRQRRLDRVKVKERTAELAANSSRLGDQA